MKAMVATKLGSPEVLKLQTLDDPIIEPNDLLIEVHASAVNPVDCKMRKGDMGDWTKPPMVLGFDVSGIVREVGDMVEGFEPGDTVFASPSLARPGANAELITVDYRTCALKPDNIDHVAAATLPLVTITAWEALHQRGCMHPGETVLIHGGAGGVGHIAIQLAKLHGCRVITTASRDESIELCRRLGANVVINYKSEDLVQRVNDLTESHGCQVILDTISGQTFNASLDCLAVRGRLVTILPPPANAPLAKLFTRDATLAAEFMGVTSLHRMNLKGQGEILKTVAELVEADKLKPHIASTYSLEDLLEAHRLQETGHVAGKIAIQVR